MRKLHSPQWIPVDIKLNMLHSGGYLSKEILFYTINITLSQRHKNDMGDVKLFRRFNSVAL